MSNITRNNIIAAIALGVTLFFAAKSEERKQQKSIVADLHVAVDTSTFKYKRLAYVPVNIPAETKKEKKAGKLILKVRNTSFSDSLYLSRVDYYDTNGTLISNVLDSGHIVLPMATREIHVKKPDPKILIDNFIVGWRSNSQVEPLIQVVSLNNQNIAIARDNGILIEDHTVL